MNPEYLFMIEVASRLYDDQRVSDVWTHKELLALRHDLGLNTTEV